MNNVPLSEELFAKQFDILKSFLLYYYSFNIEYSTQKKDSVVKSFKIESVGKKVYN